MKVRIVFDLSDDDRRALGALYGERTATRVRCRRWIESCVSSTLQRIHSDREELAATDARVLERAQRASPRRYGRG